MTDPNNDNLFVDTPAEEPNDFSGGAPITEPKRENEDDIDDVTVSAPEGTASEQITEGTPDIVSPTPSAVEDESTVQEANEVFSSVEVPSWGAELKCLMESLSLDFQRKIKYDVTKQAQIDQLYRENVAYKEGQLEKFKKQLVLAVIEQIDDAEKLISHYDKQDTDNPDELLIKYQKLLRNYKDLTESFRDMLLDQFDIVSWQSEPKTSFDPRCQRVLKKTPTDDLTLDKKICESIRFGYRRGDSEENASLIRPEIVNVYIFDPNLSIKTKQAETGVPPTGFAEPECREETSTTEPSSLPNEEGVVSDSPDGLS